MQAALADMKEVQHDSSEGKFAVQHFACDPALAAAAAADLGTKLRLPNGWLAAPGIAAAVAAAVAVEAAVVVEAACRLTSSCSFCDAYACMHPCTQAQQCHNLQIHTLRATTCKPPGAGKM